MQIKYNISQIYTLFIYAYFNNKYEILYTDCTYTVTIYTTKIVLLHNNDLEKYKGKKLITNTNKFKFILYIEIYK